MSNDRYAPFNPSGTESKPPKEKAEPAATFDRYAPYNPPAVEEQTPEPKIPLESYEETSPAARAAITGGAAVAGGALNYRSGMFGPQEGAKFSYSRPGMGVEPLSQFKLGTQPGQVTEEARRSLQDLLAKLEGVNTIHTQQGAALRESLERAIMALPEASVERNIALQRLAELGGIKAPSAPPLSSSAIAGTGSDLVNKIQSAQTGTGGTPSSLSRAFGQHEYEMQAKLLRDAGVRTVDDLARMGIVDKNFAQYMVSKGMLLPTPEGRVLVRPEVIMNPQGQPVSLGGATAEASAEEAAKARARAQAEVLRAQEVERARQGYRSAGKSVSTLETSIPALTEKYAIHLDTPSAAASKLEPNVRMAEQALNEARYRMPSPVGYAIQGARKALPVLGGVMAGVGTGELGLEAYEREQRGDPIGATIAGLGAGASGYGMIPSVPSKLLSAAGALTSVGALYLYDKYGPAILPKLEKDGLIPKGWNPENYSIMDGK